MHKHPIALLLSLVALVFAGCTTTGSGPAAAPPAPLVEAPPARITGSEEASTMLDNFTVFVAAVDGVPVGTGRAGWNTALPLRAGERRLTVVFNRGVFAAHTDILFTAASDAAYQIRFASDAQFLGQSSYCEFWIVDTATDQPVTGRVRVPLVRTTATK